MGEEKGGDVVGVTDQASGVEDVEQVSMEREANRTPSSRADFIGELQSVRGNSKNGNLVAAGVAREKPTAAIAKDERALIAQAATSTTPVCGKLAKKR